MAITTRIVDIRGFLSSPDVAIPDTAVAPYADNPAMAGFDTTADVIALLFLEDESAEAQEASAAIARGIIEAGTYMPYDLGGGERFAKPSFDRLARDLAVSSRPESRAWSAQILKALDRGTAGGELSTLLADADQRVRDAAVDAIQEVDLRHNDWIESTMLRYFEVERGPEAEYFPAGLVAKVDALAVDDLVVTAEAFLDDHPGNPGALFFLLAARSN
ncbi:MAG: hypothetical protein LH624_08470 [Cryobacterium sp.]|nr:hypothetical protein [Cryobacterium sp.]